MTDTLVQWQDESGAWRRGYPVAAMEPFGPAKKLLWYYDDGGEIHSLEPKHVTDPNSNWPPTDDELLVMPEHSRLAIWVEIGKLQVVPTRTD